MSAHALARQLFAPPGATAAHTRHLLAQAAAAHARLLHSVIAPRETPLARLRDVVERYLRGPAPAAEKRFVLDDPQLVEALHELAPSSALLCDWDAAVAPGCYSAPAEHEAAIGCGRLGNVVAELLLRECPGWCGTLNLATDAYGRVHLPFCDWLLVLLEESHSQPELCAHRTLRLHLDGELARWTLADGADTPVITMPRTVFDAMFVRDRAEICPFGVCFGTGLLRARFERAACLGDTAIRFESIAARAPTSHAELTGGIIAALVDAVGQNAPSIHAQLCQCIRTIQGFEMRPCSSGHLASFSVATSPGVMGFNVQYTARDEPQLSPYCFMWLGHELGHTLHYLIDDVAYLHGWRFLDNPGDATPVIARYGRPLPIRTLFQIPYVHLFEWWLLMMFQEHDFAGLPWQMPDDAVAIGDDLGEEIAESFELIEQHARLTITGQAVMARLRELVAEAVSHWRRLARAA